MMENIYFIGLGHMGYPMASCLAKSGRPLIVGDVNESVVSKFINEFPACSAFKEENAGNIDTVITMLPNSNIVETALLGTEKGFSLTNHLKPGSVVIDMSSSEPLRTRALAEKLKAQDITLMDAPVSGGVKKAANGTLAIMMGGDDKTIARCKSILEIMGHTLVHVGNTGAGHAAKALNNFVSAAGLLAVVDALHIGQSFGIEPETLVDVLNASSGKNNTTENKAKQYMLNGKFNSGFTLNLMVKDVGIAINLGKDLNYQTRFGDACLDTWKTGLKKSDTTTDHTELYRLINGDNTNESNSAS